MKGRDNLEDTGVDGWRDVGLDLSSTEQGPVMGFFCEQMYEFWVR
jgi:hypothetical protein